MKLDHSLSSYPGTSIKTKDFGTLAIARAWWHPLAAPENSSTNSSVSAGRGLRHTLRPCLWSKRSCNRTQCTCYDVVLQPACSLHWLPVDLTPAWQSLGLRCYRSALVGAYSRTNRSENVGLTGIAALRISMLSTNLRFSEVLVEYRSTGERPNLSGITGNAALSISTLSTKLLRSHERPSILLGRTRARSSTSRKERRRDRERSMPGEAASSASLRHRSSCTRDLRMAARISFRANGDAKHILTTYSLNRKQPAVGA